MEERVIRREIGEVEAQLHGGDIPKVEDYRDALEAWAISLWVNKSAQNIALQSERVTNYWLRQLNLYLRERGKVKKFGKTVEFGVASRRKKGTTGLTASVEDGVVAVGRVSEITDDSVGIWRDDENIQHINIESLMLVQGEQVQHKIKVKNKRIVKWERDDNIIYEDPKA